jgi:hypothetical protein
LRENFLKAENLYALPARFLDEGDVGFDHHVANPVRVHRYVGLEAHLNQAAFEFCHFETSALLSGIARFRRLESPAGAGSDMDSIAAVGAGESGRL